MAKSPVYGTQRNYRHNKKGPLHPSAGSVKMHGKKHKRMSCGCCECIDMRDKMIKKIHDKEMGK